MLHYVSLLVMVAMWLVLLFSVIYGGRQLYDHHQQMHQESLNLPSLHPVRALSKVDPQGTVIDGVSLNPGDWVLVWPDETVHHRLALWVRHNHTWVFTNRLRTLVPGSIVQINEGLVYAHTSFSVRGPDVLIPTWQHWLLSDQALLGPSLHRSDASTFVLQAHNQKLEPRSFVQLLKGELRHTQ